MVKKINQQEFKNVSGNGVVVVDFSATWCGPCQMVAPVLDEISNELPQISFYNIDVDENMEIAREYGIASIPALLILKDGQKQDMLIGFRPKQQLKPEFEKYL